MSDPGPVVVTIRRAAAADAEAVVALIARYVPLGMLLPRTPDFVSERATDFLVATIDDAVIGCVHLDEYAPSLAEIRSLVVDPTHQGHGVGASLVRAAEALGRRREYATLFAVSNNEAFFRSQGYLPRDIPELRRERSEISRFKGVFARDLTAAE